MRKFLVTVHDMKDDKTKHTFRVHTEDMDSAAQMALVEFKGLFGKRGIIKKGGVREESPIFE